MKLRTDEFPSPWEAGRKRAILLGAAPNPLDDDPAGWDAEWLEFIRTPGHQAELGDVWEMTVDPDRRNTISWMPRPGLVVIGYALTCPLTTCRYGVHDWDHAHNCEGRFDFGKCKNGGPSCWKWTGSPLDGTLTAEPSLFSPVELGGCGWHGFLRNGEMVV